MPYLIDNLRRRLKRRDLEHLSRGELVGLVVTLSAREQRLMVHCTRQNRNDTEMQQRVASMRAEYRKVVAAAHAAAQKRQRQAAPVHDDDEICVPT